jgi:uncharacterized membrane protein YbaN (DUF454 family)
VLKFKRKFRRLKVKLGRTNHLGDSVVELRKGTKIPLQYICKTLNNITQGVGIFKLWVNSTTVAVVLTYTNTFRHTMPFVGCGTVLLMEMKI